LFPSQQPDEYEFRRQMMKEQGYDTPEKVRELIHQVKLEMLKEKGINWSVTLNF